METLRQYLDRKSVPEPNSGCHLWTDSVDRQGYGYGFYQWKKTKASRLSYIDKHGDIPSGMLVCHKCDTPACINPDHLFLGTPKDNSQDAFNKGRTMRGSKNGASVLTEAQVSQIKSDPGSLKDIAKRFNVSFSLIWQIKKGKKWQHEKTAIVITDNRTRQNRMSRKLSA